jgi:type IX secretion system PorP/SprF family membrane protein
MNKVIIKISIYIVINIMSGNLLFAQNDSKLSVFNFNNLIYNPAYAGSSYGTDVVGIYTTQWVGFEGAPKTQFLSADTMLNNKNLGIGISLFNDKAGAISQQNFEANFSYYVELNKEITLSLGLKAGAKSFNVDFDYLKILNPQEDVYNTGKIYSLKPVVGAGAYLFTDKVFISFSVPNMLKQEYSNANFTQKVTTEKQYYYISGGYKMNLTDDLIFTPTFLTRLTTGAPVSTLGSLNFKWREKVIGGINFEINSSVGGYFGIEALKNIHVGYAYDTSINTFIKHNSGSHTFFIKYKIMNPNSGKKCSCNIY